MKQFTEQEILDSYNKAPAVVQEAINSDDVVDFVIGLQNTYKLHVDLVGKVTELIRNTLLGLVSPTEFYGGLLELGISTDVAEQLVKDLNEKVFIPLNKKVKEVGATSGSPVTGIPPVTITQKMPVVPVSATIPPSGAPQAPQNLPTGTPPYPPPAPTQPPQIPKPPVVAQSPTPPVTPTPSANTTTPPMSPPVPARPINLITQNPLPTGTASSAKSLAERFSVPMHDLEIPSILKDTTPPQVAPVVQAPQTPIVVTPPAVVPTVVAPVAVPPAATMPPPQVAVFSEANVLKPSMPVDTYVPNPQSAQPRMRTMAHDMEEEKIHPHEQAASSWFGSAQTPVTHSAVTAPPLPAQPAPVSPPSSPLETYGADPYREPLH